MPLNPGLTWGNIGLGSLNTWHGSPDLRVRGINFTLEEEDSVTELTSNVESDKESSVSSDGTTTNFEGKNANLFQTVATCVTASFTENTRHPSKLAMVLTILISEASFRICLYHCKNDTVEPP